MERWDIIAAPNDDDPLRHVLLISGGMSDVAAILKKFGALCGRPVTLDGDEFNMSFSLHRLTPSLRDKLEIWLTKMAPPPPPQVEVGPTVAGDAPQFVLGVPPALSLPRSTTEEAPRKEGLSLPPTSSTGSAPVPTSALDAVPASPSEFIPEVSMAAPPSTPFAEPLVVPSFAPTAEPPVVPTFVPPIAPPAEPPVFPSFAPPAESPVVPTFVPPIAPPIAPLPAQPVFASNAVPEAPPAPKVEVREPVPATLGSPRASMARKTLVIEEPIRPEWTFDTLLVGAYNRFAHAAAMSVVSAPGTMYNPLFLYGMPGTGKSHLMHSIADSIRKNTLAPVTVTSGARLSRMIGTAVERNELAGIEKTLAASTAICVDDIHLMTVNDRNKEALAKVFQLFFSRNQQVVITALYAPRSLGALEEALKFSFSKGWSVDLKVPAPTTQKELLVTLCERYFMGLNGEDVGRLHDKLSGSGYQEVTLWMQRLSCFHRYLEAQNKISSLSDTLKTVFDPIVNGVADLSPAGAAVTFTPPAASSSSEPMAVIVPAGVDGLGKCAAANFYEVGRRHGFAQTYQHVVWKTYDSMQQVGLPFEIADMSMRAGATRALIVGPNEASPLAARVNEFSHAVRHILDSLGVRTGWIPYQGIRTGAHYLNAHLDFLSAPET